jgi:hypothetical protein
MPKSTGDGKALEGYTESVCDYPIFYSQTFDRTEASCNLVSSEAVEVFNLCFIASRFCV